MGGYPWLKEHSKPSETLTKTKMEIEPNQRHLAFRHSPAPVLTTHSKHYAIRLWPTASPQTSCSGMLHTLSTLLPLPIQFKVTQPGKKGPPLQNLESIRWGLCASARPEPYAQHEASCADLPDFRIYIRLGSYLPWWLRSTALWEASYQHTILKWRACSAQGPPVVPAAGQGLIH